LQKASEVRRQLQESQMRVDDAPEDDETRQTYNFAPGHHGLVYRAFGPDSANRLRDEDNKAQADAQDRETLHPNPAPSAEQHLTKYRLQAMKWGMY
jgi:hypothetical protein